MIHYSISSSFLADLYLPDYTLVDSEYLLPIPEDVIPSEAAPILCAGMYIFGRFVETRY